MFEEQFKICVWSQTESHYIDMSVQNELLKGTCELGSSKHQNIWHSFKTVL